MNVYIVIFKDTTGATKEFRVSENHLVEEITSLLNETERQLIAVIKL